MADTFFSFVARVPECGYEWSQETSLWDEAGIMGVDKSAYPPELRTVPLKPPGWVLVGPWSDRVPFRRYDPLRDHSGLFRVFAGLVPDDREQILQFANTYGLLGDGALFTREESRICETLGEWSCLIDSMRLAVKLWDLIDAEDAHGVYRLLGWDAHLPGIRPTLRQDGTLFFDSESPNSHYLDYSKMRYSPIDPNDLWLSADFLLRMWINNHLILNTHSRLVRRDRDGAHVMRTVPRNLLTAMWLQFALSIEGNRKYRTCKECNRWFEISTRQSDHRTVRRLFCSDPCKSRDYRRRKERAIELKQAGKSNPEIATELDTEIATIKKWTAKRKG